MKEKTMCVHEWDMDNQSCVFGCGRYIDPDYGICPSCKDHATNQVQCEKCQAFGDVDPSSGEVTEN